MARDGLKRKIAAALEGDSSRDNLRRLLSEAGSEPTVPQLEDDLVSDALLSHAAEAFARAPYDEAGFDAILDSIRDPILTVAADGAVLSGNSAAGRVFGAQTRDMVGQSIDVFIPALTPPVDALEARAQRAEDTFVDLAPELLEARRADGRAFTAEITVSKTELSAGHCFVLCMRDVTGRLRDERALRESEERYRALVENAPEAIVVLDVDANRFIDANDNAARLFKMPRDKLLAAGPLDLGPDPQAEGQSAFGFERGYIERALKGGRPVFECVCRDADGHEIACEVRFIRLPSSERRLVRASIIDVTARRRADTLAYGERRVLEAIAANAPLERTLQAVVRLVEQMHPDVACALMLLDRATLKLGLAAGCGLPPAVSGALASLPVSLRSAPCGAAASLGRQVVVRDIEQDAEWGELGETLLAHDIRAACSTPIATAGDRIHGTLALYFRAARTPLTEELDLVTRLTQLAGIAIRRKEDEAALRESEARFRDLFDNVVDGVYEATPAGDLKSVNAALVKMLGCDSAEELYGRNFADFFVEPKERERLVAELAERGRVRNFEYRLRRKDGRTIEVVENSRSVADAEGRVLYFEGTIADVTERKAAERELFREKERAQVTLQSIGDAVLTTDAEGFVEYLNPVAEQLTGWQRREAQGRPIDEVIVLAREASGERVEPSVLRCLRECRIASLADDIVLTARDGTVVAIQDSAAPILDRSGTVVGAVMVFHDVSRERQLHRKLAYHASHDALTGLINRREFEERLSEAVRAVRAGSVARHALLFMDLDQFKIINDTCGHAAGDQLLRQLGGVLRDHVRTSDVLARLGGDEFALLLYDCTPERAVEVAEALREAVARFRFTWRDSALHVGASIGIAPVTADSESVAALMSAADVACYVAKDQGRNRIHVYEEGDAAERHQEMQWVTRIKRALEEERFELFYQPIVPTVPRSGSTPHYELLLRLRDEQGCVVAPDEFIPAAERYNLMPSLDRWVLTQALETLVFRQEDGGEPYTLAVNLSGTTLNDARFLDFVLDELTAHGVPPGALCFEITETAAIASLEQVVRFMRALKERGCRFSLDDFGTGLSSLTYLKNLPVDYVKIDGQFIRNVTRDAADESVVEAIARMARALRVETIAERVESHAVLKRLGELGVSYAQGFFVAVPQPVSELPIHSNRKH